MSSIDYQKGIVRC